MGGMQNAGFFVAQTKWHEFGAIQMPERIELHLLQGKQHMGQTKERGAGAVSVPAEVKEMYRALNPGATDAEIQAHYNRSHKKG